MTTNTTIDEKPHLPILEPLTEATKVELAPLPLHSNDYLEIWMEGESGHYFGAKPTTGREIRETDVEFYNENLVRRNVFGVPVVTTPRSASRVAKDSMKRIPESKPLFGKSYDRYDEWRLGKTDTTAIMVHHLWPRKRIIFRSEFARLEYEVLVRRFFAQTSRATMQAEFKLKEIVPEMPRGFHDHDERPLSDYQKVAVAFGVGHEATGLFMEQGTGKTPVTISRICTEARMMRAGLDGEERMMRVLIISPNQVRLNWMKEFDRFSTAPGKVTVIRGGKLKRIKTLTQAITTEDDCAFSVVVVGVDTAAIDYEILSRIPWDLCVIDESHYIKSSGSKRFKNFRVLRESCRRRQILTGTPIANTIFDVWTQLEFLGEGLSGFTSAKEFRACYGKYKNSVRDAAGNSVSKLVGYKNIPLLQERLARLTFSITQEEAGLDLPESVSDWREVSMSPKQSKIYRQMATELAVEIEGMLENSKVNQQMTAEHILTRLLRLAQITSGHVKWDGVFDEEGNCIQEPMVEQIDPGKNPKIESLLEMIAEDAVTQPDSKMVIWCCFVPDIKEIKSALDAAGIRCATYFGGTSGPDREAAYQDFNNDPELKVLIANPQTAGEGLNLVGYDWDGEGALPTYAGHVVFFSQNWSYIQRSQAQMRTHRRGTRMPVRVTDLVVPGTIDEEIRNRVDKKRETAMTIQDIKDILSAILDYEEDNE